MEPVFSGDKGGGGTFASRQKECFYQARIPLVSIEKAKVKVKSYKTSVKTHSTCQMAWIKGGLGCYEIAWLGVSMRVFRW